MKVQCDVCEKAEASVMCCADEAALCAECDARVHAANKVASKHQRVTLLYPATEDLPSCDICQDKTGFFFCLEDRALLCRSCDYSIHSTNALAAKHKRFLVSGIRVALQEALMSTNDGGTEGVQASQIASSTAQVTHMNPPGIAPLPKASQSSSAGPACTQTRTQPPPLYAEKLISHDQTENIEAITTCSKQSDQAMPVSTSDQDVVVVLPSNLSSAHFNPFNHQVHFDSDWEMHPTIAGVYNHDMNAGGVPAASQRGGGGYLRRNSMSEFMTETIPGWKVDELLSLTDIMSTRNFADCGSSKTDTWNYGDADWHADYNAVEDLMPAQGPAEVPSIPSPPTSSGVPRQIKTLGLGKYLKPSDMDCICGYDDDAPVVPDIGGVTSPPVHSPTSPPQKRRRTTLGF